MADTSAGRDRRRKGNGKRWFMTGIVDYDAGNIKSVEKALRFLGEETCLTRDRELLLRADRVILPGVGAFGDAMKKIRDYGLADVMGEVAESGIPFLGICLGMQLLFERSGESAGVDGLGILKGEILRIPEIGGQKVPQIGWNSLKYPKSGRLFEGVAEDSYVYFVHSYYVKAADEDIVTATTEYGIPIHVSVEKGNVFACQFHPEKSSKVGLALLRNFLNIQKEGA